MGINRRAFLLAAPWALAGCAAQGERLALDGAEAGYPSIYAAVEGEPFPVPAVDYRSIDRRFLRRVVDYRTHMEPGSVVVDTAARHAYFVLPGSRAVRYGVGVGKEEAFNFRGEATIERKAEWPRWTPTPDMIRREPGRYGKYAGGLAGGPGNPLGPRALYLYRDGRDTLYRLHGTVEPWTIGTMVSSGCVRLLNQDIIDLHARVPLGARVLVLPETPTS